MKDKRKNKIVNSIYNSFFSGDKISFAISLRKYLELVFEKKDYKDKCYLQRFFNKNDSSIKEEFNEIIVILSSVSHNGAASLINKNLVSRINELITDSPFDFLKKDLFFIKEENFVNRKVANDTSQHKITIGELIKEFPIMKIPEMQRGFEWSEDNIIEFTTKLAKTNFQIIEDFIITYYGELANIYDGQQRMILLSMISKSITKCEDDRIILHPFFREEDKSKVIKIQEKVNELIDSLTSTEIKNLKSKVLNIKICTNEMAQKLYLKKNVTQPSKTNVSTNYFIAKTLSDFFTWSEIFDKYDFENKLVSFLDSRDFKDSQEELSFIISFISDSSLRPSCHSHLNDPFYWRNESSYGMDSWNIVDLKRNCYSLYEIISKIVKGSDDFIDILKFLFTIANSAIFNHKINGIDEEINIGWNFLYSDHITTDSLDKIYSFVFNETIKNKRYYENFESALMKINIYELVLIHILITGLKNILPKVNAKSTKNYKEYWEDTRKSYREDILEHEIFYDSSENNLDNLISYFEKRFGKMNSSFLSEFDINSSRLREIPSNEFLTLKIMINSNPFEYKRINNSTILGYAKNETNKLYFHLENNVTKNNWLKDEFSEEIKFEYTQELKFGKKTMDKWNYKSITFKPEDSELVNNIIKSQYEMISNDVIKKILASKK